MSGSAKNKFMQSCPRQIVFITATEEVEVFPKHIEGHQNREAEFCLGGTKGMNKKIFSI